MVFLSVDPARRMHAPEMANGHRSVILGTLVTHCLLGSGKSGASLFRGAAGDGTDMRTLPGKKRPLRQIVKFRQ
jgi:hypothetical protein